MQINKKIIVIAVVLIAVLSVVFVIKLQHDKEQAANDNIINWEYDESKSFNLYDTHKKP